MLGIILTVVVIHLLVSSNTHNEVQRLRQAVEVLGRYALEKTPQAGPHHR